MTQTIEEYLNEANKNSISILTLKAAGFTDEDIDKAVSDHGVTMGRDFVLLVTYVYHVFSGVDAFWIKTPKGDVYLPYLPIIASNPEEARERAAEMLGQKLEDQDTNLDYRNYVSEHVERINKY